MLIRGISDPNDPDDDNDGEDINDAFPLIRQTAMVMCGKC